MWVLSRVWQREMGRFDCLDFISYRFVCHSISEAFNNGQISLYFCAEKSRSLNIHKSRVKTLRFLSLTLMLSSYFISPNFFNSSMPWFAHLKRRLRIGLPKFLKKIIVIFDGTVMYTLFDF